MTVEPTLPFLPDLPRPPENDADLVRWAREVHNAVSEMYRRIVQRFDYELTHGTASSERPAASGERRVFFDSANDYQPTYDDGTWRTVKTTPRAHASTHQNGGADEMSVAGLSGELADPQPPKAHATSHQSGGSDAIQLDNLAAPDDNTDLDASTTKHGLLLKGSNNTAEFLRGDVGWAKPPIVLAFSATNFSPVDGTTYYIALGSNVVTTAGLRKGYITRAGTITKAKVWWDAESTAGSNENVSLYIRLNNTSDTLIATVGNTDATKEFTNTGLSLAVVDGDYIELKLVCPTWGTNPTGVRIGGVVHLE